MKKEIQSKAHKTLKQNKGITLIALIITIVVLLILAVVAINSIKNDGILSNAGNVANTYNESVSNEADTLQNYLDYLDSVNGSSKWTQSGTTVTNGKVTLEVGTTVTGYTSPEGTTDPGWAVLGAENGKLLLVSKKKVESSVSLNGTEHLADVNNNGKEDGIDVLNSICASYLNTSLADSARSITVEDINRVTGYNPENVGVYDPEQTGIGTPYGSGTIGQYNNVVTATSIKDDVGAVTETRVSWSAGSEDISDMPLINPKYEVITVDTIWNGVEDKTQFTRVESMVLVFNFYEYYPRNLPFGQKTLRGDAYNLFFSDNTGTLYWLASPVLSSDGIEWGLRAVSFDKVSSFTLFSSLEGPCEGRFYFTGSNGGWTLPGARAVVSLKSDINVDETGKIS